jgi:hypothetical protein
MDESSRKSFLSDSMDGDDAEIDVVGENGDDFINDSSLFDDDHEDSQNSSSDDQHERCPVIKTPFSIASLLEAPKVPRGRRPNSKYPRVQASKSMNPLALGMVPLFPITQPVGFQVERLATPPSSPRPQTPHAGLRVGRNHSDLESTCTDITMTHGEDSHTRHSRSDETTHAESPVKSLSDSGYVPCGTSSGEECDAFGHCDEDIPEAQDLRVKHRDNINTSVFPRNLQPSSPMSTASEIAQFEALNGHNDSLT